ncbi:hypothetical protein GGR02_003447 [Anoxybacillus voinovskiensis]|uniref:Uncharacterized protein n=1 Tax=Anoxybacteroides voinovskiense TaxID=230470 RepID=A0A840DVJ5_9BACL|nr:hypothetical protein [Anoxybacillus voinovskiensis]MBB4075595.1 hypothetical protein [Anoxybacillus voinovskiensis]GGJ80306.1 hypothetical protein GCM10008982_32290 [Anoxybacillus voinovskiensis]
MATSSFGKPTVLSSNDEAKRLAEVLDAPAPSVKKTGLMKQIERSDELLVKLLSRLER